MTTAMPTTGKTKSEILDVLTHMRSGDVRWQDGRTFGMVYDAGPEAHDVLESVAAMFLHDNASTRSPSPVSARSSPRLSA